MSAVTIDRSVVRPTATPVPASWLSQSVSMTGRHLRQFARQPFFIAVTLMQPVVWLVLFGGLFQKVVDIPGFDAGDSYLSYLTPGVVVMTALFSAAWSGMGIVEDLDLGVLDRFLVTPARRGAMLNGRLVQQSLMVLIQSVIMVVLAVVLGARFDGGIRGVLVLLLVSVLLALVIASFSHALALLLRTRESVIGVSQFIMLPATFLSGAFLPLDLAPAWIATIAKINPVNWATTAGSNALSATPDWSVIGVRLGGLAVLAIALGCWATRAFRSYQASI
jgi:ABC-2 type transport system permease protein